MTQSSITSACLVCGEKFTIEHSSEVTFRRDSKRVYESSSPDNGQCSFRCKKCKSLVTDSVPGAEYEMKSETKMTAANLIDELLKWPKDTLIVTSPIRYKDPVSGLTEKEYKYLIDTKLVSAKGLVRGIELTFENEIE